MNDLPILIVEDNPVSAKFTERTVEEAGYDIFTAKNGVQALNIMRKIFFPIVITAWETPEMNGLELCRRIRKEKFPGYIYIIMLTARNSSINRIAGLEAGADQYLNKPVDPQQLFASISAARRILELERSLKKKLLRLKYHSIKTPYLAQL